MRLRATVTRSLIICLLVPACFGQQKQTSEAFDQHVAKAEARLAQARGKSDSFLAIDALAPAQQTQVMGRLRRGEVVIEKLGDTPSQIPGGLIHDWVGTVLTTRPATMRPTSLSRDWSRDMAAISRYSCG